MKVAHSFLQVIFLSLLGLNLLVAQEKADPSKLDPSDIYFQSWMSLRDADEYQAEKDFEKAFEAAAKSKRLADTVTLYHPQWKPHLVERKLKEAVSKLETLQPLLPDGSNSGLQLYQREDKVVKPLAPGLTAAEIMQANKIQRELVELRNKLAQSEDQRNADVARLQRRIGELTAERDKLAASSLESEVKELKNRIDLVEDEKSVLAHQLSGTRQELAQAQTRIADLDLREKEARKVANQLNAMLDKERNVAAGVIGGLRAQQQKLSKELTETKQLLLVERQQSQRLERLLADSRSEVENLTTERNHLLKERDHLAELLQLNQGDRIQRLIEQNMKFARGLREAEEAMANLSDNADAKSDELNGALRDVAMAKEKIIESREESDAEIKRRQILERKLADAYEELKARETIADLDSDLVEENRVLREVADKLLVTQKRRREQAALILKTARENENDPELAQAVQQLVGEELALTENEKMMIESSRSVTGKFNLPIGRNSLEEVQLSNAELRRYTNVVDGLIEGAYARGKTEVAYELCEELIDKNPGYYPAMLDQGVILLKMGHPDQAIDSFNNAMTLHVGALPYAHYLKGRAYHKLNDIDDAQREYEIAVKLDPSNGNASNRLGSIYATHGKVGEARKQFEMAYRLNNNHLEPLINLSVLHKNMGELPAALNYYRQYLKAGGQTRPDFETLLGKANKKENAKNKDKDDSKKGATPVLAAP